MAHRRLGGFRRASFELHRLRPRSKSYPAVLRICFTAAVAYIIHETTYNHLLRDDPELLASTYVGCRQLTNIKGISASGENLQKLPASARQHRYRSDERAFSPPPNPAKELIVHQESSSARAIDFRSIQSLAAKITLMPPRRFIPAVSNSTDQQPSGRGAICGKTLTASSLPSRKTRKKSDVHPRGTACAR